MKVVTLCGSLRARSSNQAVLQAYGRLMPKSWALHHFDGIGSLPHFNPDLDIAPAPATVARFRSLVCGSDVVVISTPEYMHALPGSFKNALDWLVSDPAFAGKPVIILNVDRGSTWALHSLREVLGTMSATVLQDASISLPLGSNQTDADQILARDKLSSLLRGSLDALTQRLESPAKRATPENLPKQVTQGRIA